MTLILDLGCLCGKVRIVIVDNDQHRRDELRLFMNLLANSFVVFLMLSGSRAGQNSAYRENLSLLVLAKDQQPLIEHLKCAEKWHSGLPIMIVDYDSNDLNELEIPPSVISKLQMPPNYARLVDDLHRAQVYRQQQNTIDGLPLHRDPVLFRSLVGTSRKIQQVRELMAQVADKNVTVLITGESGTGKEVVARNLHYHSPRQQQPLCRLIAAPSP